MRRAAWSYPDGMNVISESWTASSSPAVVVIAEADDFAPLMEIDMTWGDVFVMTTHPAISAEEGLEDRPRGDGTRQSLTRQRVGQRGWIR